MMLIYKFTELVKVFQDILSHDEVLIDITERPRK